MKGSFSEYLVNVHSPVEGGSQSRHGRNLYRFGGLGFRGLGFLGFALPRFVGYVVIAAAIDKYSVNPGMGGVRVDQSQEVSSQRPPITGEVVSAYHRKGEELPASANHRRGGVSQ
jgi:hypothetical protein